MKTNTPLLLLLTLLPGLLTADLTDFSVWTQVQDPPNANFTGSTSMTAANLFAASGNVPLATDIGYQSVDGLTPGASSLGYYFDPASDFSLAITYDWTFSGNPNGVLSMGFGIGEDGSGTNSAGVTMVTNDGAPLGVYVGAARVNDVDQSPMTTTLAPSLNGTMFISYDAASGDISFGASTTPDAVSPQVDGTFAGLQDLWTDGDLLVSFFMRSGPGLPWQAGGTGQVGFTNLRILSGSPNAIPEPTGAVCIVYLGTLAIRRRRR